MKDWIKYSIGTPVRILGNCNNHNLKIGCSFTIANSGLSSFMKNVGFHYYMSEDKFKYHIRSCDIEPVNPNDYYKYLKKGDYVVCIGNTTGLDYRKINTVYQITEESNNCVYFEKSVNSPKVKEFRLATYSEIEKCKTNNNEPTSLDEKVEEFPYRWFVRATIENRDILKKWRGGSYVTWKDGLCVTFKIMWDNVKDVIKDHTEISFEQFCKKFGIEDSLASPTIKPSTLVKETITEEDWKHGWYKINDNYLHYSGDKNNCYGFWCDVWLDMYTMDFSWDYKFIDTPDEALTKLFFEKAAKDYPEGIEFFPVNRIKPEGSDIADGHIAGKIEWWQNSRYKRGEALCSKSGSGIFYYKGVWAKIESKHEIKEDMETSKFEIGRWYQSKELPHIYICPQSLEENGKRSIRPHLINTKSSKFEEGEGTDYPKEWKLLTDLTEIQEFLPEGHPDKISQYEYEVVHCKTQKEWDFVLDNSKLKVVNSKNWNVYREHSCFSLKSGKYSELIYCKNKNSLIYSFQEWCDKFNHINPSIVKKETLLEEAKRRYPIGTKFFPAHLTCEDQDKKEFCIVSEKHEFIESNETVFLLSGKSRWNFINNPEFGNCSHDFNLYYENKWAKIIDEEEILEEESFEGRYLKVIDDNTIKHYPCKKGDYLKFVGVNDGVEIWGAYDLNLNPISSGTNNSRYWGGKAHTMSYFELMPVGFVPDTSKKESLLDENSLKIYEFNKGDLIVVEQDFGGWIENGEIVELGGKYWKDEKIDSINKKQRIAAISKKNPEGNAGSGTTFNFRKATEEEVAFYGEVGIGANIHQMKSLFPVEELKEKLVKTEVSLSLIDPRKAYLHTGTSLPMPDGTFSSPYTIMDIDPITETKEKGGRSSLEVDLIIID